MSTTNKTATLGLKGILAALIMVAYPATAQLTSLDNGVSFQGLIKTTSGSYLTNGTYNMWFKVYDGTIGTTLIWDKAYLKSGSNGVTVSNGVFTKVLSGAGDTTGTINADLFRTLSLGSAFKVRVQVDTNDNGAYDSGIDEQYDVSATSAVPFSYVADRALGIQGKAVSATAPTSGQVLKYNGTTWAPATWDLGAITGNLTLAGDVTGSHGSNSVVAIRGTSVSATAPTTNQVLQYNGSTWIPATIAAGGTTGVANGGTGVTSAAAGTILYGSGGTTALTPLAIGSSGQFLTSSGTAPQWTSSIAAAGASGASAATITPNSAGAASQALVIDGSGNTASTADLVAITGSGAAGNAMSLTAGAATGAKALVISGGATATGNIAQISGGAANATSLSITGAAGTGKAINITTGAGTGSQALVISGGSTTTADIGSITAPTSLTSGNVLTLTGAGAASHTGAALSVTAGGNTASKAIVVAGGGTATGNLVAVSGGANNATALSITPAGGTSTGINVAAGAGASTGVSVSTGAAAGAKAIVVTGGGTATGNIVDITGGTTGANVALAVAGGATSTTNRALSVTGGAASTAATATVTAGNAGAKALIVSSAASPTVNIAEFQVNGSAVLSVDKIGHIISTQSGTATSATTCGTSPSVTGSDVKGTVTTGSSAVTACTVTFGTAYASAPTCVVSPKFPAATATMSVTSVSTSTLVLAFSASITSQQFYYICMQ